MELNVEAYHIHGTQNMYRPTVKVEIISDVLVLGISIDETPGAEHWFGIHQ